MKKFDKGYFYYSLVSSLASAFVILLAFINITSDDEFSFNLPFILGVYAVIYIVMVIHAALYVKTSGYELTDIEIRCKQGVLFRKSAVLQYAKVHAVNKKQGLIQRIFGIAVLSVDSGATANAFKAEIMIIEKTATVDRLMVEIKQRQEGKNDVSYDVEAQQANTENRQNLYYFTSKLKLAYSAITVCTALLCLLVLGAVAIVLISVAAYILKSSVYLSLGELALGTVIITVIALILSSVLGLIGGVMTSFLGYHDFKIFRNRDDIEVNYGLFVRHTNNFKFNRIKAIRINQGPIKKLFGFASAGLEVVGYGNDGGNGNNNNNNNIAPGVLLPLCKAKNINRVIENILPDYTPDTIENKSKSYPAFILWSFFGVSVTFIAVFAVVLTLMVMFSVSADIIIKVGLLFALVLAAVLLVTAVFSIFRYRNAGLTIGKDKLTIQNGILVKTNTVINRKDLIAIEKITTPLRKAKGIYSYKIHFFTNALTNTVTVGNLDVSIANQLEDFLKY